jgi:hypothetical protein
LEDDKMLAHYPARYQDAHGEEQTTIDNDGKRLRMTVRGVEFVGDDFDSMEPTLDLADLRLASFTLARGDLCACHLECTLPLPVVAGQEVIEGQLLMRLELGHPRPNGGIDKETLKLCLSLAGASFCSPGFSGDFEGELAVIQKALPAGMYLKACINCAFSDYFPGVMVCLADSHASETIKQPISR